MKAFITVLFLASLTPLCGAAEDSFAILRNGSRVVIADVSPGGVVVFGDQGKPARALSLSQVRSAEGPLADKFLANSALATSLWRAGARLERGDVAGAEPILDELWKASRDVVGPTRAEIAAGLLACRIRRGAYATAVEPWAVWIDQSVSLDADQQQRLRRIIGSVETGSPWISLMPPVWVDSAAVRTLAAQFSDADSPRGAPHPSGADIIRIYSVAARRDSGQSWNIDPSAAMKDPAWANLAGEMVLAESGLPGVRTESRQRLYARLSSDAPVWMRQWIRLALGRSLLMEEGADDRRSGVLNLLWVASRPDSPTSLGAFALAAAASGLASLGDLSGVASVLADLERRNPDDPILESAPIAAARRAAGRTAPATVRSQTPETAPPATGSPAAKQETPK